MLALVQDTSLTRIRLTTTVRSFCFPYMLHIVDCGFIINFYRWSVVVPAVTKAQASAVFEVQPASGGDAQYIWMVSHELVASFPLSRFHAASFNP